MSLVDLAAAMLVVVIWAFNFIAAKVGLDEFPALLMLGLRFVVVALLLAPFLRPPHRRWALVAMVAVVLGGLHFGLLFKGMEGVNAGPAAIAIQLTVPFSALLAWIVYGERMGRWQLAGMAIAFAGIYILAGDATERPDPGSFLIVVIGAFFWAVANVLIKRLGRINPFVLNAWIALIAAPLLFGASAVLESGQIAAVASAGWRGWGAVVYMGVGASIIAYGLWYYLIGKYALNRIVPLTLLSPVLAVALAIVILDEPFTVRIVAGGLITIFGVAMIQFLKPAPSGRAARPV
ncbi:MAG: EamA family transporter [Rhodospirillales bacterium]|nr:EamA family transporter [Rhodospirillales bacterium]